MASTFERFVAALSPDTREDFEERAAIMEYCGGLSREDAEREAFKIVTRGKL